MAGELDSLIIRLAAETADAQRELRGMERKVSRFSKKADNELGRVDKAFTRMGLSAKKAGAAIIAAAVGFASVSFADTLARANNSMADLADTTGFTVKEFQQLRTLMLDQGMATEQFDQSMRGFAVRMGEVRSKTGGFYEFLKTHVPTMAEQLAATKSQSEALAVLENAFERITNHTHKSALANQAFGETGLQLVPILAQVGDQILRGKVVAEQFGTLVSGETVAATRELQRDIDLLKKSFEALALTGIAKAYRGLKELAAGVRDYQVAMGKDILSLFKGKVPKKSALLNAITQDDDAEKLKVQIKQITAMMDTELQVAAAMQKPIEWKVKLTPEQIKWEEFSKTSLTDPKAWKVAVSAGDPFAEVYEKANQAQAQFMREARNSYRSLERLISESIMNPLEDAFSGGVRSAREYFREMLAGLGRIITKVMLLDPLVKGITNSLSGNGSTSFGNILGTAFASVFGGFKADGGPVSPGKAYVVGEKGPEMIVPRSSGTVIPNGARGGSTSSTIYNIDARGAAPGVEERILAALAEMERKRPTAPAQLGQYTNRFPLRQAA